MAHSEGELLDSVSQSVRRFVGGMASKRISLPPLKVTRRPAYGKKSVKYFERSVGYDSVREQVECEPSSDSTRVLVEDYMQATTSALNEPTCYEVETKASIAGWESIRKMVQVTVTEMEALPLLEICLRCPAPATMRCQQCGSRSYYCQPCFLHNHTKVNIFHVAEIWKVCMYF